MVLRYLALLILLFPSLVLAECDVVKGQYFVRFNEDYLSSEGVGAQQRESWAQSQIASSLSALGVQSVLQSYQIVPRLMVVRADDFNLQAAELLKQRGVIRYHHPDCRRQLIRGVPSEIRAQATPDDDLYQQLWGLHNTGQLNGTEDIDIDAPEAWDQTTGSSDIVVGIVDSGVDHAHQDLVANMWTNSGEIPNNGVDDDGNGYVDDYYGVNTLTDDHTETTDIESDPHGTHVAGTVGAVGDNNLGVTGVNWNVKLMALKFIDADGGFDSDAVEIFDYVLLMINRGVNIKVLNNSWGGPGEAPAAMLEAVEALNEAGVVFVAAAGNEGANNDVVPDTPSAIDVPNVISVAAVDRRGLLPSFSNFGATTVDLAAPGSQILSTLPGNTYDTYNGTSMAAPHVAGVAALMFARNSSLSAAEVRTRMLENVVDLSALDGKMVSGGMLNAALALPEAGGGDDGGDSDDGGDDDSGDDDGGDDGDDGGEGDGGDEVVCEELEADPVPARPNNDRDGDGVSDTVEEQDGTDLDDPGSFRVRLNELVFSLWSGFLEMSNVLELINTSSSTVSLTIKLYTIEGNPCSQTTATLGPGEQRDFVLNQLNGFVENSHGLVSVSYSGGTIDGRVTYYRVAEDESYDFVYSVGLANPLYGDSSVSFNSNQPSLNAGESENLVANWLTIVNLDTATRFFEVETYNVSGSQLNSRDVPLSGRRRTDIDGGHVDPGPGNVGKHVIVPSSESSPYLALLTRFGHDAPASESPTAYTFAFPLIAKAGNGRTQVVALTTTLDSQNWLEVVNHSVEQTTVTVEFYRNDGTLMAEEEVSLVADGQRHFNVNSRIGDNQTGFARIVPTDDNSVLAQSMVYIRNPVGGSVLGMYGSQAREVLGSNVKGSYNLFLGMQNWLKLLNPTASQVSSDLTLRHPDGSTTEQRLTIPARGSVDLGLHDQSSFETQSDTFGVVEVEVDDAGSLLAELLRLTTDSATGLVDFAAPTEVR